VPSAAPEPSSPPRASSLRLAEGLLRGAVGAAAATVAVGLLDGEAPVVSLGVLYVLPVLWVATRDGALPASATAVLSVLAFNFFHLPPTGRLTLADHRHWAVVVVLFVVAVAAARIAEAGRRAAERADAARAEADLIAALTRAVLLASPPAAALDDAAGLLAAHLGVPVALTAATAPGARGVGSLPLDGPDGPVAALTWSGELAPAADAALRERTAPALAAVLAAAAERARLGREAVEAAALRRSNEVATTLLRTVGHDLRTPLTQISAAAAALRSPSLEEDEREELAAGIAEGSDRLADLIGKLLDLSRLQAGAAAPRPGDVPLDDVVRDALEDLARTRPEAAAVRVVAEDPPPRARVDPVQIGRIVANLVENALVHGRDPRTGRADVLVRVASRRGRAVVRVVDGGPGLPPGAAEDLFLPFRRGGAAAGTGSGLGLAIARGFAEANGGSLRVESYPGQGTAFVLELPPAEDAS
jgi:two-component system sensor histidine kinase KdpD